MSPAKNKQLTGRHVLMILMVFFGVMLVVNIYFTVMAVKSFRGEDVPRSYRQGLHYNRTIAARKTQSAMGWTVKINTLNDSLLLNIRDSEGRPVDNLQIEAKLRHPADTALDRVVNFVGRGGGRYAASTGVLTEKRLLVANARNQTQTFKFEYELWR